MKPQKLIVSLTSVLAGAAFVGLVLAAEIVPSRDGLVVHEWGTFTSVAGVNGEPIGWAPLVDAPDLPCFVDRLSPRNIKMALATVRMETPVLYFYARHNATVSVHVAFPRGWITEWFPRATSVAPPRSSTPSGDYRDGRIAWDGLQIAPGPDAGFPSGRGRSRYYAARNTDSAPLEIAGQHEKMIFYRGVGNFTVPLRARFNSGGMVEIRNTGQEVVPAVILFENRDGRAGYRVVRDLQYEVKIPPPELTGSLDELRSRLAATLADNGLYTKEAAAMIETWRDSWFETGSRLIYMVPRSMIDQVLPLSIEPSPASISRVFVGRVELLSPAVRNAIETAIVSGDVGTLVKFGRFLEPFVNEIRRGNSGMLASPAAARFIGQAQMKIWQLPDAGCIQ